MYEYQAVVTRVVDGDTVDLDLDLGLDVHHRLRVRLMGLDAPERGTEAGTAATAYLRLLVEGKEVIVLTEKDRREKYGRYLATLLLPRDDALDLNVNRDLIDNHHAVPYSGGKR